jgi:fructose-1,6-bisphosphatase I / sedoheptulose-1,7-bisphosphatase
MQADRTTLAQFLIEDRQRYPDTSPELSSLILDVALACKTIAARVACGHLGDVLGATEETNVHGERQQKLDMLANDLFLRVDEGGELLAGMVSEEMELPYSNPARNLRGPYLLVFDPLDGSSNIDINLSVGSIFSVLRAPYPGTAATINDFLQPGTEQVCAGYAIYGPSTMLVLTVGRGVYGFTLEPQHGEFILTQPGIKLSPVANEFAINASNSRFWEPPVRRYVDECLAGRSGPRAKDFNMRWVASLVAETHRILTRGGVFLYPRDTKQPPKAGRLRLLYEANPVALLIEQAGGRASTGRHRVLGIAPESLHQRTGFVFGAREEVERIETYHSEFPRSAYDTPLYGNRGLFRVSG